MNGSIRLSVHPSIRLSVRLFVTPFWLCSHHCIIMKFLGVITNDRNNVHEKCRGQRSKVKVTEVNTQLSRFQIVTPVWIHIWLWNDKDWSSIEEVPFCFQRSFVKFQGHTAKKNVTQIGHFRTVTAVWIHWWLWNDAQILKQHRRGALLFFKVICEISRSYGTKEVADFDLNWEFLVCDSSLNSSMAFKWCAKLDVV